MTVGGRTRRTFSERVAELVEERRAAQRKIAPPDRGRFERRLAAERSQTSVDGRDRGNLGRVADEKAPEQEQLPRGRSDSSDARRKRAVPTRRCYCKWAAGAGRGARAGVSKSIHP